MDVIEAQAVLFSIARKHASEHEEHKINNQPSLRQKLSKEIMSEAKLLYPDVSTQTWQQASEKLAQQLD